MIEMNDVNVIINCAKTCLRVISETETLKNKIDFSKEEIQSSIDNLLEEKASFKDFTILHSTGVFCMEIGGLDSLGLKYDYDTIQQTLMNIEIENS